jgi:hypothetical protein
VLDVDSVAADRRERAAIELVGEQRRTVGGKADGGASGGAAAARVLQVVWHAGENVALFAAEIGLQLDDGGAPRHVDAATVVDEIALVFQLAERGAEAFSQQFRDEAPAALRAAAARPSIGRFRAGDPCANRLPLSTLISVRTIAGAEAEA